jgi:hypothetical protein
MQPFGSTKQYNWCPGSCVISIEALVLVLHRLVLWHFLRIDKFPGSCCMSNGAVVRILYRLVPWLMIDIHCGSGSFLISIGALVRVLYRLVLKLVFHIDWWFGPCFVLYRCPDLHFVSAAVYTDDDFETVLTWPCREHKKCLFNTVEPTSWRPWAEVNRDVIHARSGPPLPTHTHAHTHTHTHTHIQTHTHTHTNTVYEGTVSGWLSVNRGELHRVCRILRRFTWNLCHPGMRHVVVLSVSGISKGRDNIHIEGSSDPRINPSRTLDMKAWKRLLVYTALYSRKPKFSGICNTIIVKPSPVMYFLSPYKI